MSLLKRPQVDSSGVFNTSQVHLRYEFLKSMFQEIIWKIIMKMKATYLGKMKMKFKMIANRRISWKIITKIRETAKVKS